jgi:hypothetical protein
VGLPGNAKAYHRADGSFAKSRTEEDSFDKAYCSLLIYHVCCWFYVLGIISLEISAGCLDGSLDNIDS